jgi:tetratricopeptide (TPR) repeat protein
LKRYEEGILMFTRTLELSPREVRAHFGLAKIYSLVGKAEKANEHYKSVIEIDSNRALTNHAKRAMLAIPIDHSSQSGTEHSENAAQIAINPGNIEQHYREGYSAFLHTDYDKAVEMYSAYLQFKPKDDFVWFSLGEACLRAGQTSRAIEAFQKAIEFNQNKALYFKELAISFSYLDKANEVVEYAKKAQKLGKNDSVIWTLSGNYLSKLGQHAEAVEHLQKAVKINSNNLAAKFHLALALKEMNHPEEALGYLQEVTRSPINSPLKIQAESLIGELSSYS